MARYFSEKEFACKHCGKVPGIDVRLQNILDAMRERAGAPLVLSSAYRCPEHNAAVGGVPNSFHVQGCAADVLVPDGMTVEELAKIAEECCADGVGRYFGQGFVHVDTRGYFARWSE